MTVAVLALEADDGKTIMVVVCSGGEAYANKDCKHLGHIKGDLLVPVKGAPEITGREQALILRAHAILQEAVEKMG